MGADWNIVSGLPRPGAGRGSGFSLLELLIVLALAATLSALAPPLIGTALGAAELRSTAGRITAALLLARSRAIGTQQETTVLFDPEAGEFRRHPGNTGGRLPDHISLSLFTVEHEPVSDPAGGIRFFPDGSSTGGHIRLQGYGRQYTIDVDWLTGAIEAGS